MKILRKMIGIALAALMVVGMIPFSLIAEMDFSAFFVSARAAEIVASGQAGYFATWTLDDEGLLTISGTEDCYVMGLENLADVKKVIIENGITKIGDVAFVGFANLTSVTIPDSVTKIGDSAFKRCTGLTSISIPDSVTKIGDYAFWGCTGLTSVEIPDSVTEIGDNAFEGCTGLTSVVISAGLTIISAEIFKGCTALTSVTIPNGVTIIMNQAFEGCTSLTSVDIPRSVTAIRDYAFDGCKKLTSVYYSGTESEWNAISNFGFVGNTDHITIHYQSDGSETVITTEAPTTEVPTTEAPTTEAPTTTEAPPSDEPVKGDEPIALEKPAYQIRTKQDFLTFLEEGGRGYYELVNSIDLRGETLKQGSGFYGMLDGKGKSIKNFKLEAPIFSSFNGVMRNVNFSGIKVKDGNYILANDATGARFLSCRFEAGYSCSEKSSGSSGSDELNIGLCGFSTTNGAPEFQDCDSRLTVSGSCVGYRANICSFSPSAFYYNCSGRLNVELHDVSDCTVSAFGGAGYKQNCELSCSIEIEKTNKDFGEINITGLEGSRLENCKASGSIEVSAINAKVNVVGVSQTDYYDACNNEININAQLTGALNASDPSAADGRTVLSICGVSGGFNCKNKGTISATVQNVKECDIEGADIVMSENVNDGSISVYAFDCGSVDVFGGWSNHGNINVEGMRTGVDVRGASIMNSGLLNVRGDRWITVTGAGYDGINSGMINGIIVADWDNSVSNDPVVGGDPDDAVEREDNNIPTGVSVLGGGINRAPVNAENYDPGKDSSAVAIGGNKKNSATVIAVSYDGTAEAYGIKDEDTHYSADGKTRVFCTEFINSGSVWAKSQYGSAFAYEYEQSPDYPYKTDSDEVLLSLTGKTFAIVYDPRNDSFAGAYGSNASARAKMPVSCAGVDKNKNNFVSFCSFKDKDEVRHEETVKYKATESSAEYALREAVISKHADDDYFSASIPVVIKVIATAGFIINDGEPEKEDTDTIPAPAEPPEAPQMPEKYGFSKYTVSGGLYDGNQEIKKLTMAGGSFRWERADANDTDFESLTLRLNATEVSGSQGVQLWGWAVAPEGFSFSPDTVERDAWLTFSSDGRCSVPVYPIYSKEVLRKADFNITLFPTDCAEAMTVSVPVRHSAEEYKVKMRNSFSVSGQHTRTYTAKYSFDAFQSENTEYNKDLASLSAALSAAVYGENAVVQTFLNQGFSDIETYNFNPQNDQISLDENTVACAIAAKKIVFNGKISRLLAVAVRGTLEIEWYTNFSVSGAAEAQYHKGFYDSAEYALSCMQAYKAAHESAIPAERTRLLVTGHSRAAAAVNIMADKLNGELNGEYAPLSQTYIYTFAAPNATKQPSAYGNVFNILNIQDIVTHVPSQFVKNGWNRVYVPMPDADKLQQMFGTLFGADDVYQYPAMSAALLYIIRLFDLRLDEVDMSPIGDMTLSDLISIPGIVTEKKISEFLTGYATAVDKDVYLLEHAAELSAYAEQLSRKIAPLFPGVYATALTSTVILSSIIDVLKSGAAAIWELESVVSGAEDSLEGFFRYYKDQPLRILIGDIILGRFMGKQSEHDGPFVTKADGIPYYIYSYHAMESYIALIETDYGTYSFDGGYVDMWGDLFNQTRTMLINNLLKYRDTLIAVLKEATAASFIIMYYAAATPLRFMRMFMIQCPVDVTVRNAAGEIVAVVKDDQVEKQNDGIYVYCLGDQKYIVTDHRPYTFEISGYDDGKMEIQVEEFNESETLRTLSWTDVAVHKDKAAVLRADAPASGDSIYVLTLDDEKTVMQPTADESIAPTTEAPATEAPTTEAPTTEAPTTEAPTTETPTTEAPTTETPTTETPTTETPTTETPTTEAPTTEAPTTEAPTTEAPTTEAPTTEPPTAEAPTTTEPVSGEDVDYFTLGDVDMDGRIKAVDARLALRAAARLETLPENSQRLADMDGDGKVKAGDARVILRIAARLDPAPEKKIAIAAQQ